MKNYFSREFEIFLKYFLSIFNPQFSYKNLREENWKIRHSIEQNFLSLRHVIRLLFYDNVALSW